MIYKVILAYDGSNYAGWQKQENALGIQEVIEKALTTIHKKKLLSQPVEEPMPKFMP